MQLIGMLDSPYVRRVAISLRLLDVDFSHRSLSVFRHVEEFRAINPVVKAPSLVLDDGQVLMDSSLIIDLAEHQAGRSLMPAEPAERVRATRLLGLALAACERPCSCTTSCSATRPAATPPGMPGWTSSCAPPAPAWSWSC